MAGSGQGENGNNSETFPGMTTQQPMPMTSWPADDVTPPCGFNGCRRRSDSRSWCWSQYIPVLLNLQCIFITFKAM